MEYRRSFALGIRLTMAAIGALCLFGAIAVSFSIGPDWLRNRDGLRGFVPGLPLLQLALFEIARRVDPEPPVQADLKRPSEAASGTMVVVLTGIAAAVGTGWDAQGPGDMIAPVAVLISTAVLATLVYRFAKRNADRIGEARFDTTKL